MKSFRLVNPTTLDEAIDFASDRAAGSSKFLAGGQDLLTEMKEHLSGPDRVVNLKSIPGLDALDSSGGSLRIGALTTLSRIERDAAVRAHWTALAEAAHSVASPQIRTCGTIGGNLCQRPRCWYYRLEEANCLKKGGTECFSYGGLNKYNAILGGGPTYIVHPSDLAPALVALGAEIVLRSKSGERRMPLEKFYVLPADGDVTKETVLADGEIVTEIVVPKPAAGTRSTYVKFKERESYDFALSAVGASVVLEGGKVAAARLCLGAVAPVPWRVERAEKVLVGRVLDETAAREAANEALRGAEPLSQNAYKVPLTKTLVERALLALAR
ncbi:MAG: xanthine dehydrogenase family protein subunit M [Planctomycetota bacterium]|nr:xanthine dehydrogenase family protein subunit M [Planctomycetota bacterium]